jgi:choloylglycine hydrolase
MLPRTAMSHVRLPQQLTGEGVSKVAPAAIHGLEFPVLQSQLGDPGCGSCHAGVLLSHTLASWEMRPVRRVQNLVAIGFLVLAGMATAAQTASACTGIRLTAADGTVIYARTMESALDFQSNMIIVPRGKEYSGMLMEKMSGLAWTTKYVFVGPNVFGMPYVCDGLNEKGLAVGHFVFTNFATYQKREAGDAGRTIDCAEVGTFLLGTCQSVPAAIAALQSVRVIQAGITPEQRAANAYHYYLHDAEGRSAVLEYVDGQLKVHDNPLGVVTNSPTFDWHMTNLRSYIHLNPENATPVTFSNVKISSLGQGTGLLGLPGDFTPPARFVRAVTFTHAAFPSATAGECVEKAFHLLNQFDLPAGAIRSHEGGKLSYEFTNWTTAADMKHRRYYFHTFQSRRIRVVDFEQVDLTAKAIKAIPMRVPEVFEDVTAAAK